jgi:HEAT repeat protein
MNFFNSRSIERMAAEKDRNGLYRLLEDRNKNTRLEAAQALAEMEDGAGWRVLMDTVRQAEDTKSQVTAAAMLADLAHPRAIPALEEALKMARGEPAEAIQAALEAIGGDEAEDALRQSGYEPVVPHMGSSQQLVEYDDQLVRGMQPDTSQVRILTAEQHFDQAADLREVQLTERGLVENALALWLAPGWAYAWYLRGVLFEDLDRYVEAMMCYRHSLRLDPAQPEAREALQELETEHTLPLNDARALLSDLASHRWKDRRDAAAISGMMESEASKEIVEALIEILEDEDREVRHAAIEALGRIQDPSATAHLVEREEDTWLLRFAVIEALMRLNAVDGLAAVLRGEMSQIQARNPIFSSRKDPLLEMEYDHLMEIGVLAFEKTGDVDALLEIAEGNTWTEVESEEDEGLGGDFDDEEEQLDDDLESYVDEVAQMVSLALERLALPRLAEFEAPTLQRLASVPDLTLLDLSVEEQSDPGTITVHDFSSLREAARAELARR